MRRAASKSWCAKPLKTAMGGRLSESFSTLYPAAGGNIIVNGGNSAGGDRCVPATASLSAAGGGLSYYPGDHVLSGGKSGCDGNGRHCSTRKTVWASARSEPDDLHQLGRQFNYNFAV